MRVESGETTERGLAPPLSNHCFVRENVPTETQKTLKSRVQYNATVSLKFSRWLRETDERIAEGKCDLVDKGGASEITTVNRRRQSSMTAEKQPSCGKRTQMPPQMWKRQQKCLFASFPVDDFPSSCGRRHLAVKRCVRATSC